MPDPRPVPGWPAGVRPTVIILHETVAESWIKDAGTFAMIVAVIGTGWWLGSEAMQWIGFLMVMLVAVRMAGGCKDRMTPQQAADLLCRKYGALPPAPCATPPREGDSGTRDKDVVTDG